MSSDRYNPEGRIESPKIIWVRRDGLLPGSAGADHDMRIYNIGCPARSEQPSDVRGINPTQSHDVGRRLPKEAGQTSLLFRSSEGLSESTRRDGDPGAGFEGTGQQYQDPTVIPVDGYECPGVHGDARHHAAGFLVPRLTPSTSSAHCLS